MLASVGLVHLNGRVYDPYLGRMTSADPMVGDPFSGQSWNRYSCVWNNPLAYTDPTGFCPGECIPTINPQAPRPSGLMQLVDSVFKIAAGTICMMAGAVACLPMMPMIVGVTSFYTAGVTSGSMAVALKAGVIAAATALAFRGVGDLTGGSPGFDNPLFLPNVLGHALVGCGSAVASGGKCGQGALSAAIPAAAGPLINGQGFSIGSLIMNTTLGGLASVAGGGKFANGAVTGAFGYLANQAGHNAAYHEQLKNEIVDSLRMQGWTVVTEVSLSMYYEDTRYTARVDIMFTKPEDPGKFWMIDVKTGESPRLEEGQSYIYPSIGLGGHVNVLGQRAAGLGFQDGQLLPAGVAIIHYQLNAGSPAHIYYVPAGDIPYRWRPPR
jgi:RHS repeat-associated protein